MEFQINVAPQGHRECFAQPDPFRHQHARHERSRNASEGRAERPSVPVIMITAYGDDATRKRATELGAAGLLSKPIDFGFLREEISQRLEGTV